MDREKLILQEILRRTKAPDVLSYCFQEQKDFILDPSHFKTAFTTRRAGKSTAIGVYIVKAALEHPGCNLLYLGLSKETASRTLRKDILNPILKKFNIKVNETEKKITFPNGSILYVQGTNASARELAKVLGQKYYLAFLDEAQSYTIDTKALIYQSLGATVQDLQGSIIMTGTPTDDTNTFFYEVTKQEGTREPGWKVHEWNTFNNIAIQDDGLTQAEKAKLQIQEFRDTLPNVEETDWFQQQFLGQWIIANSMKVYKFNDDRNVCKDPNLLNKLQEDENWRFICGVDFGSTDASAICALAYHRFHPNVYVVHSEKHTQWTTTDVANRIHDLGKIYHFSNIVGDSAAAQSILTIAKHNNLPIKPTVKTGKKRNGIAVINADFITGNIKIVESECKTLLIEMKKLIWDPKSVAEGEYKELASLDNHECDSFNYAFHMSKHYRAKSEPTTLNIDNRNDLFQIMKKIGIVQDPKKDMFGKSIFENSQSNEDVIQNFKDTRIKGHN